MKMLTVLLCALATFAAGEDIASHLAAITRDYDAREAEADSTAAHSRWLKSPHGAADAAFLATHFDALRDGQKYEMPMELARTGLVAAVPLIKKALAVSDQAMSGVFYAVELGEPEPGFGKAVAPSVAVWIGKSVLTSRDTAVVILPLLDPELAATTFFIPELTGGHSPRVHLVLGSCNDAGLVVPRAVLDPLLAAWEKSAQDSRTEYRIEKGYQEAIIALASHDAADALRRAGQLIKIRPTASDSLAELPLQAVGLIRLYETLAEIVQDEPKFATLPEAARLYFAATYFAADCSNGGISQALSNSTGDYLPLARKAAEVSGDRRQVEWLEWMCKPFGNGGPSSHRVERLRQMEAMKPDYVEQESELSEAWAEKERQQNDVTHLSSAWMLSVWVAGHADEIKAALPKKGR